MPSAPPAESKSNSQQSRNGAQIVCEALIAHGVDVLFGYTGGAILPFYDALNFYPQLHHVTVRHEQAAAHAAVGYARVTGKAGVCVTTSGPGATNLLTGIMDAHLDSIPMVILSGQVGTGLIGSDAFQETDMMCMTAPITKHNFQPRDVKELEETLHAAFLIANSGRPGPVYIDLPKNVLEARVSEHAPQSLHLPGYRIEQAAPDANIVDQIATTLKHAKRPFLLVGGGSVHGNAGAELLRLAEQLQLPAASTIMAKGLLSEDHPQVLGPIGMYGRKSAQYALMNCDVLLAVGCRFSDRITGKTSTFAAGKKVIQIDIDAYELGKNIPAHVALKADAKQALQALLAALEDTKPSAEQLTWLAQCQAARSVCERCVPHTAKIGVHPKHVIDAVNRFKKPHDIVTTGVGQHQMFASHFLQMQDNRTFITSGGAGTMGYGLPAAIGAALAKPSARVFVIDGDGSFQMTSQELATVTQEGIHPIILVLDNHQLGMVRQWQDRVYDGRHKAVWFEKQSGHPDLAMLANSYGVVGVNVATVSELEAALATAVQSDSATLIRVLVEANIDMLPMMPSGTNLSDFYGNCVPAPGQLFNSEDNALIQNAEGSK